MYVKMTYTYLRLFSLMAITIYTLNMDEQFRKRTLALRGNEAGEKWLSEIPNLIKEFEEKWSIKIGKPFGLFINYVAPAMKTDGSDVVIKIGFPEDEEFITEVNALKIFNGEGIVRLLDADLEKEVILLERLKPGIQLSLLEDDKEATRIIALAMKKLWKPVPSNHNFPTLADWSHGFQWYFDSIGKKDLPMSVEIVKEAQEIFSGLVGNPNEQYLLHGDLHHENVLSAQRESWLAIDPKGVIGEREYEVAAMLRNPHTKLLKMNDPKKVLRKRLEILSEILGFDEERIIKWGYAQTILSVIWNLQGGNDRWNDWIKIAEIYSNFLKE